MQLPRIILHIRNDVALGSPIPNDVEIADQFGHRHAASKRNAKYDQGSEPSEDPATSPLPANPCQVD
jgi:hypothetical protein